MLRPAKFKFRLPFLKDKVSELNIFRLTLNNYNIKWPELIDIKECSSFGSSFFLAPLTECCDESNENDQIRVDIGKIKIWIIKGI